MSNEDLDKLEEGLAHVYSVIGDDTFLTAKEIKEALWYYYFDREETIEWALGNSYTVTYMSLILIRYGTDKIAKEQAAEEKKKAKEAAKKGKVIFFFIIFRGKKKK